MPSAFLTFRSFLLSVVLHALAAALLVMSFDFTPKVAATPAVQVNIVEAVKVDAKQVEAEVERLREADRKKEDERKKLEKQVADMQKKAKDAEKQRKVEEEKLADLQKKKEKEQKEREVEEKKLAETKKQQEELDRKRKLEEEKKRKEEEERKRKAEEAQRKQQMEAEQRALEAEQLRQDQALLAQYIARINSAIIQNFNLTGLPPGLSCVLRIRMVPGGEVVAVQVATSSGNAVFDQRASDAVTKASPLPVPDDPRLFEKMRDIRLTFKPGS
jgi:colicin import membrane protein